MPELPEVETTLKGIEAFVTNQTVTDVIVRNSSLRWPIPESLPTTLRNQLIQSVSRRGKYLLFTTSKGTLIIHLGMSGKLRILDKNQSVEIQKHDHVDIVFGDKHILRYNDPRRFGAVLWTNEAVSSHKLIRDLGPEPLTPAFSATYLFEQLKSKKTAIKTAIMNSHLVVGVGNIYANESLFKAGIHPKCSSHTLTELECEKLVDAIKDVLRKAIKAGGTTLKDFRKTDGKPGYFAQELSVYGREGLPCKVCGNEIQHYKETQRATFYCPLCQDSSNLS
jgi:formamidopyrimidine-DNA glycosylase